MYLAAPLKYKFALIVNKPLRTRVENKAMEGIKLNVVGCFHRKPRNIILGLCFNSKFILQVYFITLLGLSNDRKRVQQNRLVSLLGQKTKIKVYYLSLST